VISEPTIGDAMSRASMLNVPVFMRDVMRPNAGHRDFACSGFSKQVRGYTFAARAKIVGPASAALNSNRTDLASRIVEHDVYANNNDV